MTAAATPHQVPGDLVGPAKTCHPLTETGTSNQPMVLRTTTQMQRPWSRTIHLQTRHRGSRSARGPLLPATTVESNDQNATEQRLAHLVLSAGKATFNANSARMGKGKGEAHNSRLGTALTRCFCGARPSNRVQVDALTERVKMLENLLSMSKESAGPGSLNPPPLPLPTGEFFTAPEPATGWAYQSSEDNEADLSFPESVLYNIDDSASLDDFDPGGPSNDGLFPWNLDLDAIDRPTATGEPSHSTPARPTTATVEGTACAVQQRKSGSKSRSTPQLRKARLENDSLEPLLANLSGQDSPSSPPSSITESLVDQLLDLYFRHFQTFLQIVDEKTFRTSRAARPQSPGALRESLLYAMMAAGARFFPNPALKYQFTTRSGDCLFARRSKALLESEIGHADMMTVQALLILGELETSAGNEMSGCMYSGG